MSRTRVKICGLTCLEDAHLAAELGADYLGLVFAESPRKLRVDEVLEWIDDCREGVELVGVFQNHSIQEVISTVERLDLDLAQLHGDEEGSEWNALPVRIIEARSVDATGVRPSRLEGAWANLLDTASAQGGGSGRVFDWSRAVAAMKERRSFVAGGLTPSNVGELIATISPFAVDVSSGVEASPGRKDPDKLRAFFEAVGADR